MSMSECQTTSNPVNWHGDPCDLPILAQAKAGTPIRFEQITLERPIQSWRTQFPRQPCQPDYPRLCATLQRSADSNIRQLISGDQRLRGRELKSARRCHRTLCHDVQREQSPYAVQPDHRMCWTANRQGSLIQTYRSGPNCSITTSAIGRISTQS